MTSTVPSELGPYRILGLLGSGGMGAVYRGRDDRLQRDVAVKVLRDAGNGSPERHARLMWEARAASALHHSSIVAVFDVGTDQGVSYVVTELIEGDTLRYEIDRGPLPVGRLVSIATQIAEGVAAAHAAGITHGDLKPENVMITRDGRVKIVDFGLASAIEQLASSGDTSKTPVNTLPGLILGTVAYASPERARGVAVDARSDQFSFGVMLFEMATATQPFKGDSAVETLAAIINGDAPDVRSINPRLPSALRWILDRCLAKIPAERYASTADLVLDLRALRDRAAEPHAEGITTPSQGTGRRIAALLAVGGLVGAAGVTAWLWSNWQPGVIALADQTRIPFATDPVYQGQPAWSPDGTTLAYVAAVDGLLQVFVRGVGQNGSTRVTYSRFDCEHPFWGPGPSGTIYYHSPYGTKVALFKITLGGDPVLVEENAVAAAISPRGDTLAFFKEESDQAGTWTLWLKSPIDSPPQKYDRGPFGKFVFSAATLRFSPDGTRLLASLFTWAHELNVLPYSGFVEISMRDFRPREVLHALPARNTTQSFDWLADSRHIVTALADPSSPDMHLWIADLDSDQAWPITASSGSEASPVVSSGGRIAYTAEATNFDLAFVPIDGSSLRPVMEGTRPIMNGSRDEYDPAWSRTGKEFVYVTNRSGQLEIRQHVAGQDSPLEQPLDQPLVSALDFGHEPTFAFGAPAYAPDGKSVVYQRLGANDYRLWRSTTARSQPTRLTSLDSYEDAPTWSPTNEIAFVTASDGKWKLVKGESGHVLTDGILPYSRPQWSPDGKTIAVRRLWDLVLIDPATGRPSEWQDKNRDDWLTFAWNPKDGRLYGLTRDDDRVHFSLSRLDSHTGATRTITPHMGFIPIASQPIRGFTWTGSGFATSMAHVKSDIWILDGIRPPSFLDLFARNRRP